MCVLVLGKSIGQQNTVCDDNLGVVGGASFDFLLGDLDDTLDPQLQQRSSIS